MDRRTSLLSASLVGIAIAAGNALASAAPEQITFWEAYARNTPVGDAFYAVVDRFNETHPDIHVNIEEKAQGGFFFDNYMTAVVAGAGPDAVWLERSIVANWARGGALIPLAATDELKASDFLPAPFAEIQWQGKQWAVPWNTDIRGLFWNSQILTDNGFDQANGPQTWDDLNSWNAKLTQRDNNKLKQVGLVPWQGNWFLPAWVWSFGGELYDAANHRATFATPQAEQAVAWMAGFLNYYQPSELGPLGGGDLFATGHAAFTMTGPAALPAYTRLLPGVKVGMGPMPHPAGGHNGTWGGGFAIGVPTGTKHRAAAMAFSTWMGSKEAQLIYAKTATALPTNLAAARAYIADLPADQQRFYNQVNEANIRYPFVWLPIFNGGLAVYKELQEGKLSPAGILAKVEPTVQAEIDKVFAD